MLEIRAAQPFLRVGVAISVDGGGQILVQVALLIGERRVERPVRVEDVDAHQPWAAALLLDEFDGAVGAPGGLVQFGGYVEAVAGAAVARGVDTAGVDRLVQAPDAAQPVGVGVAAPDELQRRQGEERPSSARPVEHPVVGSWVEHLHRHLCNIQWCGIAALPAVHCRSRTGPERRGTTAGQAVRKGIPRQLCYETRGLRGVKVLKTPVMAKQGRLPSLGVIETFGDSAVDLALADSFEWFLAADPDPALSHRLSLVVHLCQQQGPQRLERIRSQREIPRQILVTAPKRSLKVVRISGDLRRATLP